MSATAASVDTRVRVDRFEKVNATVLPRRLFWTAGGVLPDLIADLCEEALRTRVVSSWGVRSAIERRWRGAKGDVWGVAGEEYARVVGLRERRQLFDGLRRRAEAMVGVVS